MGSCSRRPEHPSLQPVGGAVLLELLLPTNRFACRKKGRPTPCHKTQHRPPDRSSRLLRRERQLIVPSRPRTIAGDEDPPSHQARQPTVLPVRLCTTLPL